MSNLEQLKQQADSYGIKYGAQIGEAGLEKKIDEFLKAQAAGTKLDAEPEATKAKPSRKELLAEASKLIRVNIQCMNPVKKDWDGEIITAGNSVVGTFRKFVHFSSEDGYHIPNIIYKQLKARKFNVFYNKKTNNGITQRAARLTNEFVIDVLDPLTQEELDELKKSQAARG
ncbi:hypothetical protein [Alteromonas sp. BMJM2]|uniref:hypothetical protein n=1 Tax=Alteromonas sp. BMJM2 TaxID=2954241 RepID=UPI0022B4EA69|nr:hypothetical protein [Alteromonas sp. BMJM2]